MTRTKTTTENGQAAKRCLDHFYEQYVRNFNPPDKAEQWLRDRSVPKPQMVLPLLAGAKDMVLLGKLVAGWDEETVRDVVDEFFRAYAEHDPRVERSNMTVGAFYDLAQYVMLRRGRHNGRPADDRTAHNVAAVRRATMRKAREE